MDSEVVLQHLNSLDSEKINLNLLSKNWQYF